MPLLRYFIFVGGALLALLFIADACLPGLPVAQASSQQVADLSVIRIHSDQKWPARVVFDTTRPAIMPAPAPAVTVAEAPSPQKSVAIAPPLKVREAFAEMRNPNEPRSPEPKRKRKSAAKNPAAPPRMLVAQQPAVVFFGNNVW